MEWKRWQKKHPRPNPAAAYPWLGVAWDWAVSQGFDEVIRNPSRRVTGFACSRNGIRTEVMCGLDPIGIREGPLGGSYVPTRLGGVLVVDRDFIRRETDPTTRRMWRTWLASGWAPLPATALEPSIDRYDAYVEKERMDRPLPLDSDFLARCDQLNVVKFEFYRDWVKLNVELGESPETQIVGATELVRKTTSTWWPR